MSLPLIGVGLLFQSASRSCLVKWPNTVVAPSRRSPDVCCQGLTGAIEACCAGSSRTIDDTAPHARLDSMIATTKSPPTVVRGSAVVIRSLALTTNGRSMVHGLSPAAGTSKLGGAAAPAGVAPSVLGGRRRTVLPPSAPARGGGGAGVEFTPRSALGGGGGGGE